jgi:hypothetical protein
MSFQFQCATCGQIHHGVPAYHADRPAQYWDVPESKRESDVSLTSDSCVIAGRFFFIRGCIDIPVLETNETFTWGVWVSLKEENFFIWQDHYEIAQRSHVGPFFGWLCTRLPAYPETQHLKTMAHLRNDGIRPRIVLEPTDHPLAVEQSEGISITRLAEIIHQVEG